MVKPCCRSSIQSQDSDLVLSDISMVAYTRASISAIVLDVLCRASAMQFSFTASQVTSSEPLSTGSGAHGFSLPNRWVLSSKTEHRVKEHTIYFSMQCMSIY